MSSNDSTNRQRRNPARNATSSSSSSSTTGSSSLTNSTHSSNGTNGTRPVRSSRIKNQVSLVEDSSDSSADETSNASNKHKMISVNKTNGQQLVNKKTNGVAASTSNTNSSIGFKVDLDRLAKLESFTGLSRSEAMQLLEASNNNLETAVNLHFSNPPSSSSSSSNGKLEKKATINSNNKRPLPNDDIISDSNSNSNLSEPVGDDYVRAPIPQKVEKLLDYDPYALNSQPQNKRIKSAFDSFRNIQEEYNDAVSLEGPSNSSHSRKAQTLSSLYRPPIDILFKGTFEASKIEGCLKNKWILLNVQDQTDFTCQSLNRDLWRDETVKEILKANFIFVQIYYDSVEGKKLINYYRIDSYPFIGILDPRTGEKTYQFKNLSKMDQLMFCEKITNYLCDNELNVSKDFAVEKETDNINNIVIDDDDANKKKISIDDEKEIIQVDDDSSNSSKNSSKSDVVCLDKNKNSKKTDNSSVKHSNQINNQQKNQPILNGKPKKASDLIDSLNGNKASTNTNNKTSTTNNNNLIKNNHVNKITNKITKIEDDSADEEEDLYSSDNSDSRNQIFSKKEKVIPKTDLKNSKLTPTKNDKNLQEKTGNSIQPIMNNERYETPDTLVKDCVIRVLYPNGNKLDFSTNGNSKFSLLIDYLKKLGFKRNAHELIERLMPTFKATNIPSTSTSEPKTEVSDNSVTNQSRNLFNLENEKHSFKDLNLFPRVFLLLQEL